MSTVICAENLSKKYTIGHQPRPGSASLRDSLEHFGKRLLHPFLSSAGMPSPGLATTEEFWALRDICFSVQQGERVGIIGRNGAGKSTLLKILSRITEPSAGSVRIRGRVASLLEVGTGFHPDLSGRENIYFNGTVLGMSRGEVRQKFDEIVAFAEVEQFIDTPVKRYSSGMYMRLAFAVAAHLEPEILIVDEVLAVGDAQFQAKCLGKMKEAGREGRTVLFVSHNMHAVRTLCEKGMLLDGGEVLQYDKVDSVIDVYFNKYANDSTCINFTEDEHEGFMSFNQLTIHDNNGKQARVYQIFDDINFKITISNKTQIKPMAIAINISNPDGMLLANIHSQDAKFQFSNTSVTEEISVRIKDVRLYPGEYNVSLVLKVDDNNYIFKNDCLTFAIKQNYDVHPRPLIRSHGLLYLNSEWVHA